MAVHQAKYRMHLVSEDYYAASGRRTPYRAGTRPARCARPADSAPEEALPVWLAVLLASQCRASGNGPDRSIRWTCISGRAMYTNAGLSAEHIEPFGIVLPPGHTLAVTWTPGETAYTTEIYCRNERCA